MQATKDSMRKIRARKICDFLVSLKRLRIGTGDVESSVRKTCSILSTARRVGVVMQIMRQKISDAFKDFKRLQLHDSKTWKKNKRAIPIEIRCGYLNKWRRYTGEYKRSLVSHFKKRVDWLRNKWSHNTTPDVPDIVREVVVKDDELPAEFDSEPRMYGGVTVGDNEEEVLRLPPKFGLYRKVNIEQCVIDTEEALNKLRWSRLFEQNDNNTDNPDFISQNTVNINRLKVTGLPFNPSVSMPGALSVREEVKLHVLKTEIEEVARSIAEGSVEWSNLSTEEREALKGMKEKGRDGEVVYTVTDKSGRWSCDSVTNYKLACSKHLNDSEKTPRITMEEHNRAERELNCQVLALTRMMGLEEGEGGARVRQALTAQGSEIAPFYGLRKDHKMVVPDRVNEGPPVRPLCGAKECAAKRVSYMLSRLLAELVPGNKTHCASTEELIAEFERVNDQGNVQKTWVVGSLDVDSLYPSLDIARCARVVRSRLESSELVFEHLKWKEIALYLKYHLNPESDDYTSVSRFLPRRKGTGRPPEFVGSGSDKNRTKRYEPWVFPWARPRNQMVRTMFCMSIEIMICETMRLHDFSFSGELFRQSRGGSIGLDLTGVVADIYMCEWDENLIRLMEGASMTLKVYKRYKDDIDLVVDVSARYVDDVDPKVRNDETMSRIKDIAETIDPNLKVTTDVTSDHETGRLPVLDLEVWIGQVHEGEDRILYCHYMKAVATRAVIDVRSSHSTSMKFHVMVNEVSRILRNCSRQLEWKEVAACVTYF